MRILLIDREVGSQKNLTTEIKDHYIVDTARDGEEGICLAQINEYAAIVVDTHEPDFCTKTRQFNQEIPILILLQQDEKDKRLDSLVCGADAVLTKPILSAEVLAYLKILINRAHRVGNSNILKAGDLSLDLFSRQVFCKGREVFLRRKEYEILHYLTLNKGRILSKEKILENVWDLGYEVFSNSLEVHIRSIRSKIDDPTRKSRIKTIYGIGYKLQD